MNVDVVFLELRLCGVGGMDLGWVLDADLEYFTGGRRCGRRDIIICVCVIG